MFFFLAKVVGEKQHADDLLNGKLFANRLGYFKQLEDSVGRGDKSEGAIVLASDDAILTLSVTNEDNDKVESITITGEDLAGPLDIRPKWFDHVHVYCMYAGHSGGLKVLSEENIGDLTRQLEVPDQYQELGNHAIIVTDVRGFLARVQKAAEREGYRICGGLVDYYDYASGTPHQGSDLETIFAKRKEFAWQREHRVAIDTGEIGSEPISLEIGTIDDIAFYMPTSEINSSISIHFPEDNH